ncbi:dihydrolipoamide dehydrogenase, putative [Trypanosoma brucei gambiense DAL972]|uniref:Dihydrolipoamide dehydrogenase, putative n=3 Tax=Trypanosoma brucei TaxID=5691 RepID=Q584K1_TRYB2|nr:dihydrolipoamide dehydrogenase, putative [Trypanosoma brucei gambiense DAL972]XP_844653.1 dihydrolipoamide dehydrogenase, putative [Trypanosoma brucei brucei TREU927]AAX80550.1 dihydrolipoamide dehydrogenase, putative [Trypanosoma brucei]RHW73149.1 dihydrolipoamide dehydrogenase [Trypanosoma brucei equiperdum]AAZ11094.1 dihydrolipoamide dehydrogenase, putative [Trypanosoma brucei brucei TREU927]CBH10827.1 dihydrolipoamide dehydrogenase, putative [Trypanosoma brucei gambiense DAL972]|eukprot:XP_011773115.1 dihydrolipoamide dehydrogenase, putative [Trypanosoma brucei gambiense DAL972]
MISATFHVTTPPHVVLVINTVTTVMIRLCRVCSLRSACVSYIPSNLPRFDVCVIGAGPAGIAAALRAVDYNKRVCLVEAKRIGGCDLWDGALQSKTLWEMSKYVSSLSGASARRVFDDDTVREIQQKLDLSRVQQTLQEVSATRETQTVELLRAAGVTTVFGRAMFSSPHELDVHSPGANEYHVLTADYFIIATGSVPRQHEFVVADHRRVVTTDTIMQLPIPSSLVIIGAGAVGCEFASIYANFGRTEVTIIDKAKRILPKEDEDIANFVEEHLTRRGVRILNTCTLFDLESWEESDDVGGCVYSVRHNTTNNRNDANSVETYEAERALVSLGRTPNLSGLGLENTACKVTGGQVTLDAFGRCVPYKHIYAVGDVSADRGLVNLGEAQGRGAVEHIYGEKPARPVNSSLLTNLSTILFLEEEVACVGLNEEQCRALGFGYIVARYDYSHLSRAIAMGGAQGFCKVIVTNDRQKLLLGVRAVGAHAGSIVEVASLAIRQSDSVYSLLKLTAAYPAVVQGFVECIRMILGRSNIKPNTMPNLTLTEWRPPHGARGRAGGSDASDCAPSSPEVTHEQKEMERNLEATRLEQSVVRQSLKVTEDIERR